MEGKGEGRVDCISALIGENGSGKTSVAVLLQDIMEPSGSMPEFVTVFGERNAENEMEFSVYCRVSRDIMSSCGIEYYSYVREKLKGNLSDGQIRELFCGVLENQADINKVRLSKLALDMHEMVARCVKGENPWGC